MSFEVIFKRLKIVFFKDSEKVKMDHDDALILKWENICICILASQVSSFNFFFKTVLRSFSIFKGSWVRVLDHSSSFWIINFLASSQPWICVHVILIDRCEDWCAHLLNWAWSLASFSHVVDAVLIKQKSHAVNKPVCWRAASAQFNFFPPSN